MSSSSSPYRRCAVVVASAEHYAWGRPPSYESLQIVFRLFSSTETSIILPILSSLLPYRSCPTQVYTADGRPGLASLVNPLVSLVYKKNPIRTSVRSMKMVVRPSICDCLKSHWFFPLIECIPGFPNMHKHRSSPLPGPFSPFRGHSRGQWLSFERGLTIS